ncbi:MAG: PC4/YdbC family ssDNA-binding protein [Syntrophomonas sp.]|nr:PC4/YdbC family ssDNA-binding protein [Syntrophomonas sp.]
MADIKYAITKPLGVLSEGSKGWQKEINMVSWNERKPKIDIRDWGPDHEKMGKGITLNNEELKKLKELLDGIDLESLEIE